MISANFGDDFAEKYDRLHGAIIALRTRKALLRLPIPLLDLRITGAFDIGSFPMSGRQSPSQGSGNAADYVNRPKPLESSVSMKTTLNQSAQSFPTPTMLVLYEDRAAGLRAMRFSGQLKPSLGYPDEISTEMWRCEMLEFPEVADQIVRQTASAEYVILSCRSDITLSHSTKRFVESWLRARKSDASGLIALFAPAHQDGSITRGICSYLEYVTKSAGVAFFSHHNLPTNTDRLPEFRHPASACAEQHPSYLNAYCPTCSSPEALTAS
jgi:hypothetical protein